MARVETAPGRADLELRFQTLFAPQALRGVLRSAGYELIHISDGQDSVALGQRTIHFYYKGDGALVVQDERTRDGGYFQPPFQLQERGGWVIVSDHKKATVLGPGGKFISDISPEAIELFVPTRAAPSNN